MKIVKVREISGEHSITQEDGQKVFELVRSALQTNKEIELDFEGVTIFASPFFNAAIGQLMKDFKAADLNRLLKVSNLSPIGQQVLNRVIENAKRYFSSSEDYRKAQWEVLSKLGREN